MEIQPKLFSQTNHERTVTGVILFALGEFQHRGHELANREIALDRLHGAFVRAAAEFEVEPFDDELLVQELERLGSSVTRFPAFVAKRPYRVVIPEIVAESALTQFKLRKFNEQPS